MHLIIEGRKIRHEKVQEFLINEQGNDITDELSVNSYHNTNAEYSIDDDDDEGCSANLYNYSDMASSWDISLWMEYVQMV